MNRLNDLELNFERISTQYVQAKEELARANKSESILRKELANA